MSKDLQNLRQIKCPFGDYCHTNRRLVIEHVVLHHLTPETVFKFADFLIDHHTEDKPLKYRIEAEFNESTLPQQK